MWHLWRCCFKKSFDIQRKCLVSFKFRFLHKNWRKQKRIHICFLSASKAMQQLSPEGPLLSQTDKVLKKFSPAWLTNKKRKTIRAAYQAEGYFLTAFVSWAAIDRVRGSDAKFSRCRRTAGSAQLLHMKLFVIHYQLNDKCTSRRHIKSLDPVPLPCVSIKAAAIPYRKPEPFQEHWSGGCAGLCSIEIQ